MFAAFSRYTAPQAKLCAPDTSKVPISLNFDRTSCVLAHPNVRMNYLRFQVKVAQFKP
jgi:hypothetical protein